MTTLYDISKIIIELGKMDIEFNKKEIDQITHQQIENILMNPYLADYQKRYLISELLAERNNAHKKENWRKALLFVADFINDLTKDNQGK